MAKVRVPQESGTITITPGGEAPRTWNVKAHMVEVEDADVAFFVVNVTGAERVVPKPGAAETPGS